MRRIAVSLVALGATLCLSTPALRANTITVDGPVDTNMKNDGECTLREAVQEAQEDHPTKASQSNKDCALGQGSDVIEFDSKASLVFLSEPIFLSSNLTIRGAVTILPTSPPPMKTRFFVIAGAFQIRFEKVKMLGGSDTASGGAGGAINITTSAATVEIVECHFSGNEAFLGGVLFNSGSDVTISESSFEANTAFTDGGALAGGGNWKNNISRFDSNKALHGGGAIFCGNGNLKIDQTHFVSNSVLGYPTETGSLRGGGAVQAACKTEISSSLFEVNFASGHSATGGAVLFMQGGESTVRQSVFRLNQAMHPKKEKGKGGGAIAAFGPLVVDRSAIEGNTAIGPSGGGGIVVWGQQVLIVNSTVGRNLASLEGDNQSPKFPPVQKEGLTPGAGIAVWNNGIPHVEITNTTLAGNNGTSEIFLDPNSPGVVILKNTIVDGWAALLNCEGNLPNILDGLFAGTGNNLQTDANAAPSCNVPVGKPGGLNTPGVFPKLAGTTPQPQFLAFQYLVPAPGGDAAGAGNGTTCLNAPVNAKDILDNARTEACTIGAAEAK